MSIAEDSQPLAFSFPDLSGKVAIVTGASRGIGCGIAEILGGQGMRLTLTARSTETGEAFAETLTTAGVECLWVSADLATRHGAQHVFDQTVERFGRIDVLVNNAADMVFTSFLKLDEEAYHKSFEKNMRMVYGPSFHVARHMAESGGGVIIHLSSVGGLRGHRGRAGYDALKGAIDALTRSMALDLAPDGIRVNSVAPGAICTRSVPPELEHMCRKMTERIPLGRFGTPIDIGWTVAFLASSASSYITGQVVYVDGGLVAQLTPPGIFI